jgi:hypothetical protein
VKVLLIQLPVQSHDYEYSQENIPLSLGYLQSYAQRTLRDVDILIAPPEVANFGGDAAIGRWVESQAPDVIGLGCSVWNHDRTLHLCGLLKRRMPDLEIVLGGPEVTRDNRDLFQQDAFDFAVIGEGEETFRDLLECLASGGAETSRIPGLACRQAGQWRFNSSRPPIPDLNGIPSPYLSGLLRPSFLRTIALETVRGCPYRCTYCYYHKSYPSLRTFELERIRWELTWALEQGVEEVYFVDPCFARRPQLTELLGILHSLNRQRQIRIQCELKAEDLSQDLVQDLALAGVEQVEVGLQTTNPRALRLIQRSFHREAFIRGVRMLRGMGIQVMVDLMVGLPGDTLEDVRRSVDFVVENDLCDDLKLYPLSVLPGTLLRERAEELGIHYQLSPPYLALRTRDMSPEDIFRAFQHAEEARGGDFFPLELPTPFTAPSSADSSESPRLGHEIVHEVIFQATARSVDQPPIEPFEIGQRLCFRMDDPNWEAKLHSLRAVVGPLLESNPYSLIDWIIPEELLPSDAALKTITDACLQLHHPSNREYFATHTPIRSLQIFVITKAKDGIAPIFMKLPLWNEESLCADYPFSKQQRVCWIAFPEEMSAEDEEAYIESMIPRLGKDIPSLRLADVPKSLPRGHSGLLHVRQVSLK